MKSLALLAILLAASDAQPGPAANHKCSDGELRAHVDHLVAAAAVGEDGEVFLTNTIGDGRFMEPYSGAYFQISAGGVEPFASRSLWDRKLRMGRPRDAAADRIYESDEFAPARLRIFERIVRLPSSPKSWRFQVALAC